MKPTDRIGGLFQFLPQLSPSYIAVIQSMVDSADDFSFLLTFTTFIISIISKLHYYFPQVSYGIIVAEIITTEQILEKEVVNIQMIFALIILSIVVITAFVFV
jgi:hypothetical protein